MAINMNYCKFANTLTALRECADDWQSDNLDEEKAQEALEKLMIEILQDLDYEVKELNAQTQP